MDIASLASQHGKDGSQTPLSGLQTPPSAFERRRNSMHQLVRATSQPSLADSPSPVSSFYLQRQSSTLPPYPDATLYTATDQQRTKTRAQQQAPSPAFEGDGMPWSSFDGLQQPATKSWQHQLHFTPAPSHPQPSFFSSSQGQWSSNPASMLKPDQYTQHQQLHHPATRPVVHQEVEGHGTAPDSSVHQPKLVSEPPSASWSLTVPRDNSLDTQMATSLSSLAIAGPRDLSSNDSCSSLQDLLLAHLKSVLEISSECQAATPQCSAHHVYESERQGLHILCWWLSTCNNFIRQGVTHLQGVLDRMLPSPQSPALCKELFPPRLPPPHLCLWRQG